MRPVVASTYIASHMAEMCEKEGNAFPLPGPLFGELMKGLFVEVVRVGCPLVCLCRTRGLSSLIRFSVWLATQTWENMVRLATTPSPFVYRHLVATLTLLYVFTFPFGFVSVLGAWVIPFSAIIALAFYGIM